MSEDNKTPTYGQALGKLLRDVRTEKGMSQAKVAKGMGIDNNGYVAGVEMGQYKDPDKKTLERYAKALGITNDKMDAIKRKAKLMAIGLHEENIFTEMMRIPILGDVPCGDPEEAIEEADEYFPLPYDEELAKMKGIFGLRANGLSMKDAGIYPGDIIIIQPYVEVTNGNIVVAKIDEEATLKYYHERGGYVELRPANKDFKPIKTNDPSFRVVGKLVRKVAVE
jgi:SOS regulatory protein LexA